MRFSSRLIVRIFVPGGNRTVGGDVFDVELIRQERDEGASKRNILLHADETHVRVEDLRDGTHDTHAVPLDACRPFVVSQRFFGLTRACTRYARHTLRSLCGVVLHSDGRGAPG
jgi:hypothetical protein